MSLLGLRLLSFLYITTVGSHIRICEKSIFEVHFHIFSERLPAKLWRNQSGLLPTHENVVDILTNAMPHLHPEAKLAFPRADLKHLVGRAKELGYHDLMK